ncbi:MAG: LLM class flavin-dependent oxidoreductase, partial [Pseudomonadota bacterium]
MEQPLQIGVSLDGSDPPASLRALVETADAAGAANLWLAAHLFNREPVASAGAALAASRNLGVVLMAISPYTVHPVYAAMAAATLDEFFPGRLQLCFGVGAPVALQAAGVAAERPVETLREAIEAARLLLSGERVKFAGHRYRISGRLAMGAHPLPLWLAASGPQMLELACAKAEGVVISAGASAAFIAWC